MAVVFKYEKQQYQNKQDDLKELNDELKDLLIEFQDKKLQMVEFWTKTSVRAKLQFTIRI